MLHGRLRWRFELFTVRSAALEVPCQRAACSFCYSGTESFIDAAFAYYVVSSSLTPISSMFYGRRLRQLFVVWGISLLLLVGLYRIEVVIPALHDMILPVYWVIAGFTAFMTLRWLRARSPEDRRGKDRRHADRRGDAATGDES